MTSAEFKTIRESLGLTAQWVAEHAPNRDGSRGVQVRSVQYWEAGRSTVPADVAAWLNDLDAGITRAVTQAMAVVRQGPAPDLVSLVRYRTDEELWQFRPDFAPLPAVCHAILLARLRSALAENGILSRIIYLERDAYLKWLADRQDSDALRAAWAAQS